MTLPSAIRRPIPKKSSLTLWEKLTRTAVFSASVITLISLWLIWISYGYDLAYLREFGLSPDQLGRSPSDYLIRSYRPFLELLDGFAKILTWDGQQSIRTDLMWASILVFVSLSIVFAVMAWLYSSKRGRSPYIEQFPLSWLLPRLSVLWSSNMLLAARGLCSSASRLLRLTPLCAPAFRSLGNNHTTWQNRTTRWQVNTRLFGYGGGLATGASMFVAAYALFNVIFFVFATLIVTLTPLFFNGALAGARNAKMEVINPIHCVASLSQTRSICVRVIIKGCEVARGREIDRTDKRIFLYVRSTKKNIELPLNDAIVETVLDEKSAAASNHCKAP